MRDLILKMSLSIDGFVGGPDGGIKWVFDNDQEAAAWTVETVWNASLHIVIVPGAGLARSSEAAAVIRDHAMAGGEQRGGLLLPRVAVQRPAMDEHDR